MNNGVGLLHDFKEINLRTRFAVSNRDGLDAQLYGIIAVIGQEIFKQNISQFNDV